jgi:hypothetical protein
LEKTVHGHIDCPHCGAQKMMRITSDRNGKPFGHCDDCNGQLRVGGNSYREKKFIDRYPFAAGSIAAIPVTVTANEPQTAPPAAPVSDTAPDPTKTHHGPVAKRSAMEDALRHLGGIGK